MMVESVLQMNLVDFSLAFLVDFIMLANIKLCHCLFMHPCEYIFAFINST